MTKSLLVLLIALLLGGFVRGYQLFDRYYYGHDADLAAWVVKDMLIDGHPRLIGQLTSSPGIFIGPLFYYLLVPLYFISDLNPAATLFYPFFIGLLSIFSIYYVAAKVWGKTPAGISALLYAASFSLSQTERDVVPTTPVFLWTIWFVYAFHLIFKGSQKGLILGAILFSLVWHIHLALGLLGVVALFAFFSSRKFSLKDLIIPAFTFVILSLPLFAFEFKHDFVQLRSIFSTFGSASEQVARTFLEKSVHVAGIAAKIINTLYWDRPSSVPLFLVPVLIFFGFFLVTAKENRLRFYSISFLLWFLVLIGFFIRHPINISEYYLNALLVPTIIMTALTLSRKPSLGYLLALVIVILNLAKLISSPVNAGGFFMRESIVKYIAYDSRYHGYPCISISYMVDPGNDLGYRFLFYRENLHVNRPSSGSPVYTIVFPHSRANSLDFTFGSLGLVLPDYGRYTKQAVDQSCSGENSNLTDPMFGFTN